jgi:hypothetical protein
MPGALLTTSSQIKCPHGGTAVLKTANTTTSAGARVLVETDVHDVFGCLFTVGTKYQPCTKITWTAGAGSVTINGKRALVMSSVGLCQHERITQGIALIAQTQQKATGR